MFVKPNPGLKVLDPVRNEILPEGGKEVQDTSYWRRRIRDGDVTEVLGEVIPDVPLAPSPKSSKKGD